MDATRTTLTVVVADEPVRIVDVAAFYTEGFQRPGNETDVRKVLRRIEEYVRSSFSSPNDRVNGRF